MLLDRKQTAVMFYAFLGIFSLILIVSILVTIDWIQPASQAVKDYSNKLIYVSFTGAMLQLFYAAYSLRGKTEYEIHIAIVFATTEMRVELDPDKCTYSLYDRYNKTDGKLQLPVHRRGDSWECVVRLNDPEESVRLFLEDYSGATWSTANIGMKLISADAVKR